MFQQVTQIGPQLRFIQKDSQRILQQINHIQQFNDDGTITTGFVWVDVPLANPPPPSELLNDGNPEKPA